MILAATMSSGAVRALTIACIAGAGLVAGVYFLFSNFVMRGLRSLPAPAGMAAMQSMNKAAPNPLFVLALVGTGIACAVLGVVAATSWSAPGAPWALVGSALYVASLLVTMTYHVPRNNAFDLVDPSSPDAAGRWARYLSEWLPWNHARASAALASVVVLAISLVAAD